MKAEVNSEPFGNRPDNLPVRNRLTDILCDMQAKYADVLPVEEVKRYLASLPKGLFELPRGVAPMA